VWRCHDWQAAASRILDSLDKSQFYKTTRLYTNVIIKSLFTERVKFVTQQRVTAEWRLRLLHKRSIWNGFRVVQQRSGVKISRVCVFHKRPRVNNISVVIPSSPVCVCVCVCVCVYGFSMHEWGCVSLLICVCVCVCVCVCSPCWEKLCHKCLFSWVCVQQGEALLPDRQHTDWKRSSKTTVMSSQPPRSPGTSSNHPASTCFFFPPNCTFCFFFLDCTNQCNVSFAQNEKGTFYHN